jgi:uncharacterized OsmC-like protein
MRNENEANRIKSIAIHYVLKGKDLPEKKVD